MKSFLCVLATVFVLSSTGVASFCIYDAECPNKECCLYDVQFPELMGTPSCGPCAEEKRKHGTKAKPKPGGNNQGSICRVDKDCDSKTFCCEQDGFPIGEYRRIGTCDDCSVISGYRRGAQCLYDTDCSDQKCCIYHTKYESQDSVCGNCNAEKRKYGTKVKPTKVKSPTMLLGQRCRVDEDCLSKDLWCYKGEIVWQDAVPIVNLGKCQDNTWKAKYEKNKNTDACLHDKDCKVGTDCCIWKGQHFLRTLCHNCEGMLTKRNPKPDTTRCRKDAECVKEGWGPRCCLTQLTSDITGVSKWGQATKEYLGLCLSCSGKNDQDEMWVKNKTQEKGKTLDKGKTQEKGKTLDKGKTQEKGKTLDKGKAPDKGKSKKKG